MSPQTPTNHNARFQRRATLAALYYGAVSGLLTFLATLNHMHYVRHRHDRMTALIVRNMIALGIPDREIIDLGVPEAEVREIRSRSSARDSR